MAYQGHILKFEDVTSDIRIITLQLSKDRPYIYHAGQYAEVTIEGCDPRYFSIANAPRTDNTIDIHVKNSGGPVSHILCSDIKQGQAAYISTPHGRLKLHPDNRPKIFLAGGTGITPFLAMIEDMRPTQSVHIYWGMDRESDFYIRPQKNGVAMHYCTDIYPVDSYLNSHPEFISGSKILKQVQHDKSPDIYLSGPPAMVNDSLAKLLAAGVDESNIFYDGK